MSEPTFNEIRRDQPFDEGWLFRRGEGIGLEKSDIDDNAWRRVDLPHDWSIEDMPGCEGPAEIGPFARDAVGHTATGFSVGGEGWYRRHFRIDQLAPGARVEVLFDGIHLESDVWLNGDCIGGQLHGYIPFACDLTPSLRVGDNVLAVRVRNLGRNSRWYSGSGIYRQVRLDVLPASRIARWGVAAHTRRIDGASAELAVRTSVEGGFAGVELVTRLRFVDGGVAAEARSPANATVEQCLELQDAVLWSPDSPYLYVLESELILRDRLLDRVTQPFGVRIVTMDAQQGLSINGKRLVLRGGCIHHDNGLLGACAFPDADERRIRLLRAQGFNALRSAHNPASRSFREACDRLGMLLIEEAFDMWHVQKEPDDFARSFRQNWSQPVEAMVLAARNSPSVIMWSIGNEIPGRADEEGVEWQWRLADLVHRLDSTRPVTAAINGVLGAPLVAAQGTARDGCADEEDDASTVFLDVAGYNYRLEDIEDEQVRRPKRIVYGSETYAREAWHYARLAERAPWFLGEFVWTAMDYLGEAGIGASAHLGQDAVPYFLADFPWINAWCGDIDLIGDQKAPSRFRDVVWGVSPLELAVQCPVPQGHYEWISNWGWSDEVPDWTFPQVAGGKLAVRVYTSGERVDLMLNGVNAGTAIMRADSGMRSEFMVDYQPGRLEAVAWSADAIVGRKILETTGAAHSVVVAPERERTPAGRGRLAFLPISIVDARGRLVAEADQEVVLVITGEAELLGFGNAGPVATGSFQASKARTYRGRALAILRSTGTAGSVRVDVRSVGLLGGSANVEFG